jgi:hypothetical protein
MCDWLNLGTGKEFPVCFSELSFWVPTSPLKRLGVLGLGI